MPMERKHNVLPWVIDDKECSIFPLTSDSSEVNRETLGFIGNPQQHNGNQIHNS